jgi:hypothetical protein
VSEVLHPADRVSVPERSVRVLIPVLVLGSLFVGLVVGTLVSHGHATWVPAIALIALPVVLWQRPELAPATLLFAALLIEQFPYSVGLRAGAATSRVPLFHGVGGLHVSPADGLLFVVLVIVVARSGTGRIGPLPRSPFAKALLAVALAVVIGVAVGVSHHGQIRFALTEVRPFFYLTATFAFTSMLVTSRAAVRAVLWVFVIAIGFKALQGLLIFLSVRHMAARPDAVLSHEEALFFSLFLLLTLSLWLFEVRGRLRTVATWLVPLILAGDLANTRRAAWLVLGAGVIALLVVAFAALPARRPVVGRLAGCLAIFLAVYLPLYWNKSGGLAQPARAIHSAIKPSPRDASSDLYRVQEDANLVYNIRHDGPLGKGFGVPIDYALPIEDISDIDPFIAYVPHNGVLYIFMRLGAAGAIAFWTMLGLGIIAACRLARSLDRELAVVGAVTAAMLVAYAFEGHTDQGFFYYRVAFVMGTLLGVAEAARKLAAPPTPASAASAQDPA